MTKMTIDQSYEALGLFRRLSFEEYQARRSWIARITDPVFDMESLYRVLTSTTYGVAISAPFPGAVLIEDGPGDEAFDVSRLQLLPVLKDGKSAVATLDMVLRGRSCESTNWGQRAAFAARDAGNAGKISLEVWPVGRYAFFTKTVWHEPNHGYRYSWFVIRDDLGFHCNYDWFGGTVGANGHLPSLRPPVAQPSSEASKPA